MQPTTQEEIFGKLKSCVSVLKGDLESITRVGKEIFLFYFIYFLRWARRFFYISYIYFKVGKEMVEDATRQGVKYMEVIIARMVQTFHFQGWH